VVAGPDAQAREHERGVGLGLPTVQLGEARFELGGAHAVGLGEIGFRVERVLLFGHGVETLVPHEHDLEDGDLVECEVILPQERERRPRLAMHHPRRRLDVAREDLGRLAGAVRADEAVAVAREELDVHVLEEFAAAELDAETGSADHGSGLA